MVGSADRAERSGVAVRRRGARSGYILIAFTFGLAFLFGMVGLATDVGTMYTAKNEAQSFADSAAMSAAMELNGTPAGIASAIAAVSSTSKGWLFGTRPFADVTTTFGTSPDGAFLPAAAVPNPPTGYIFARVETVVDVPLYLLPLVVGRTSSAVRASAVAGRYVDTSYIEGLFPFSPFTHNIDGGTPGCPLGDPGDPFGFKVGERYTLRWGPGAIDPMKTQDLKKACSGDKCSRVLMLAKDMPAARGYIMLNAAVGIRESIVSDAGYYANLLSIGVSLNDFQQGVPPGTKQTEMDAIADRVAQDTDSVSKEYGPTASLYTSSSYKYKADNNQWPYGNGRRLVIVPINGGNTNNYTITGFARFFLDGNESDYRKLLGGDDPACAEYIGPVAYSGSGPSGGPGLADTYSVRLYQ